MKHKLFIPTSCNDMDNETNANNMLRNFKKFEQFKETKTLSSKRKTNTTHLPLLNSSEELIEEEECIEKESVLIEENFFDHHLKIINNEIKTSSTLLNPMLEEVIFLM